MVTPFVSVSINPISLWPSSVLSPHGLYVRFFHYFQLYCYLRFRNHRIIPSLHMPPLRESGGIRLWPIPTAAARKQGCRWFALLRIAWGESWWHVRHANINLPTNKPWRDWFSCQELKPCFFWRWNAHRPLHHRHRLLVWSNIYQHSFWHNTHCTLQHPSIISVTYTFDYLNMLFLLTLQLLCEPNKPFFPQYQH